MLPLEILDNCDSPPKNFPKINIFSKIIGEIKKSMNMKILVEIQTRFLLILYFINAAIDLLS